MIMVERTISTIVLPERTVVIPIEAVGRVVLGVKLHVDLTASVPLDFYVFSQDEYKKLPHNPSNASPFFQRYGTQLREFLTLPGSPQWVLLAANRRAQPIQLVGTFAVGAM